MLITDETICAVSTASGMGAIAIIRLAGPDAISIADKVFRSPKEGKKLSAQRAGTFHYGTIFGTDGDIDEVIVSIYRAPHSFSGDDMVEIACHGSVVIQRAIMQVLIDNGARTARPGEFTQRAFANGKMDLSQAEAVADLIAAESEAARRVALSQMRGGLSNDLKKLREELLQFCTLLELELDFSEEDVEFADRSELIALIEKIDKMVTSLANTFKTGNAIKNGIPVAIAGPTNAGKSTLLNALLGEERAIVSNIHGTTRDTIEDTIQIEGQTFRFIDTAGIRTTEDTIEQLGINRTFNKINQAQIVLSVTDATLGQEHAMRSAQDVAEHMDLNAQKLIIVLNKSDLDKSIKEIPENIIKACGATSCVAISANNGDIAQLQKEILKASNLELSTDITIVTNARHFEALIRSHEAITRATEGLTSGLSGELVAMDIHDVLDSLASITGEVSSQDVLNNIFAHFCIGK